MYDLHRGIMYSSSFQSSFPLPYSLLAEPTRFLFRRWAHKILIYKDARSFVVLPFITLSYITYNDLSKKTQNTKAST